MALIGNTANPKPSSPFFWGQGGRQLTPEQIAREREIAAALMQSGADYSPVAHWAQGLARVAQAGVGAFKDWRATQDQEAGMQSARDKYGAEIAALLGGGSGSTQVAAIDPVAAALVGAPETATDATAALAGGDFLSGLVNSESGGNWAAQNDAVGSGGQAGHYGRLQFGHARLQDAMNAGVIPQGTTPEQFMASPELQQAAESWHFADIDQQAANMGLTSYYGQTIGGVPINENSIRAMAHLGGIGGAQKFVASGGQYNPADSNGTRLSDYGTRFGGSGTGAPAPVQVAQAASVSPLLLEAMSDPWAREAYGPMLEAAFNQQLRRTDPGYQLDQQIKQAQLAQLLSPPPPKPDWQTETTGTGDILRWDNNDPTAAPSVFYDAPDAAPELTDTQVNLAWRAEQAGLTPGTPEYAEFMRSGGQSTGMALTVGSDGTVQFAQGGEGMKALTEGQSKDVNYLVRGRGANDTLAGIDATLTSFISRAANVDPTGTAQTWLQSEEFQLAQQAADEFKTSILRKDTGATVTPQEDALYDRLYIPQPGNSPALIKQKAEARARALAAIEAGIPSRAIANLEAQGLLSDVLAGTATPPEADQPANPPAPAGDLSVDELLELYR